MEAWGTQMDKPKRATARLRYVRRLGVAFARSAFIVLKSFAPWAWVLLAISWFVCVLLALAYLHQGSLTWIGNLVGAVTLVVAFLIASSTAQRWITVAPGFFGSSVFAGLINYSRSGVSLTEAATLLASLIVCSIFSASLAKCSLTKLDRVALTTGLMALFIGLFDRERMPVWVGIMVVLFAMPWIGHRLGAGSKA